MVVVGSSGPEVSASQLEGQQQLDTEGKTGQETIDVAVKGKSDKLNLTYIYIYITFAKNVANLTSFILLWICKSRSIESSFSFS